MAKSFLLFVSLRFYYGRNQYFFDIAEAEAFEIDNKNVLPGPFDMCIVQYFFSHAHYAEIKGTFVSEDISLD